MNTKTSLISILALTGALLSQASMLREEIVQIHPLSQDGTVSIENINGGIRILTWEENSVRIEAVKLARSQSRLDEMEVIIDPSPTHMRVKTQIPKSKIGRNSEGISYTVTVPSSCHLNEIRTVNGAVEISGVKGRVRASSVNGQVSASGLKSETDFSTVNGSIRAEFDLIQAPVSLKSVNGSVTIQIPDDTQADLSAHSVNGGIRSEISVSVKESFGKRNKIVGRIGEGGPELKLSTVNGGINIDLIPKSVVEGQ